MNFVRRTRAIEEPALLRITAAQFSVMVEAGAFTGDLGVELRGGLLYQMNPQYVPHLRAKSELHEALLKALWALGSPLRVASEGSVLLGDSEVPQPDLIVWEPLRSRGPVPGERVRLVVEVSDTTLAASGRSTRRLRSPNTGSPICPAGPFTSIGRRRTAPMRGRPWCPSAKRSGPRPWRASPFPRARWTTARGSRADPASLSTGVPGTGETSPGAVSARPATVFTVATAGAPTAGLRGHHALRGGSDARAG
jgi:hypothetical protein